jgi:hypothetical protein
LDTSVLVSGLLFGGTPGKLLDLWKTGTIRLIISRVMLDEFLRVLAYPNDLYQTGFLPRHNSAHSNLPIIPALSGLSELCLADPGAQQAEGPAVEEVRLPVNASSLR